MWGAWIAAAALSGLIAVAAGAYGSHGLESDAARWMETGSRYQMWHGLALLAVLLLRRNDGAILLRGACWAFLAGMLLFSFSLYLMALTGIAAFGSITPFGGLSFMLGWIALALYGLTRRRGSQP
jgi:uncharacterized membrane protein YgdD (TMEM256/DUF423 family)